MDITFWFEFGTGGKARHMISLDSAVEPPPVGERGESPFITRSNIPNNIPNNNHNAGRWPKQNDRMTGKYCFIVPMRALDMVPIPDLCLIASDWWVCIFAVLLLKRYRRLQYHVCTVQCSMMCSGVVLPSSSC